MKKMNKIVKISCKLSNTCTRWMDCVSPAAAFLLRLYISKIFIWSGWLKITDFDGTVALFENEYNTGFLSARAAAILGTSTELILPIFFMLGLGARLPALGLFIFNLIMVFSYPFLLGPDGACALKDHVLWGVLIGVILLDGPGKWSVDQWLTKHYCKEYRY